MPHFFVSAVVLPYARITIDRLRMGNSLHKYIFINLKLSEFIFEYDGRFGTNFSQRFFQKRDFRSICVLIIYATILFSSKASC